MIKYIKYILLFIVKLAAGYITRLEECGTYYANFTIIQQDTYFQGNILSTFLDLSRKECGLLCITKISECMFFNHNILNNTCELHNISSGRYFPDEMKRKEVHSGWYFVSTDYGERLRGEYCFNSAPCNRDEICYDDCSEKGYTCTSVLNIATAHQVTGSQSSYKTNAGFEEDKAFDGLFNTKAQTDIDVPQWWGIDLHMKKKIQYFYAKIGTNEDTFIRIGNIANYKSNPLCIIVPEMPHAGHFYHCTTGIMEGQHIYLHKETDNVIRMTVFEIEVYVQ